MESDLPTKNSPDKPADGKENQQATQQIPPSDGDCVPHSKPFWDLFDNIFKMLEGVAFVSWMIQEYILPDNQIFLFIAIVTGLAGVFYLLAHKTLPHRMYFIVTCWVIYVLCIWSIFTHSYKPATENPATQFQPPEFPQMVSLEIGQPLDPKDPFGFPFIVHNQSRQTIHGIWGLAYWNDASGPMKRTILGRFTASVVPLKPGLSLGLNISGQAGFPQFMPKTFVNIEIGYTPDSFPHETNQIFKFCVAQDTAGNYVWIPRGEGETLNDVSARIRQQKPSNIADVFPILEVKINSVENISYINQKYPLKISYSWKNVGSATATWVYIEWCILDEQDGVIVTWVNRWSEAALKQILWPGMTNGENRFYRDPTSPAIYEGIMSGRFKLIGIVSYNDLETNDFSMQIKAVRTNDVFETRILGFCFHSENTNIPSFTLPIP
jgi:hypothetical protein